MPNSGRCSQNLSGLGIQTATELLSALLAASPMHGTVSTADMAYQDSTSLQGMMKKTITASAKSATDSRKENNTSTRRKLTKGTVKEPGINSCSKNIRSVKGVSWR